MVVNEGRLDSAIRVVVGVALLSFAFVSRGYWWGWIGVVPLATGLFGYCPLYQVLGINSCGKKG